MSPRRTAGKIFALVTALVALGVVAALVAVPFVGGAGLAAKSVSNTFLDTGCDVTVTPSGQTTTILASDGKTVIATLFDENRKDVTLSQIPSITQQALIATEDRRFYQENGIDLRAIIRAAVSDSSGGTTQGGSTLSMQYVKQVRYFQATTPAAQAAAVEQDLDRKIKDAKCALQLEKTTTKAQILQDYFNIAFFGENSYGIQVAAQTYFGISASKLDLAQSATLVGLLQSPSAYDPFLHPQAARERRDEVLDNLVTTGDVTAAQAAAAKAQPVVLASSSPPTLKKGCANANGAIANVGFFCDYAVAWLESTGGLTEKELNTGGLRIVTTLDASLQNSGQAAVWASGLDPTSATALVMPSVNPENGAVTTMITSRHYGLAAGQTTLPLFTTGYAGAGSTYKFFTALAALKAGVTPDYTLDSGSTSYTVRNCPTDADTTAYTTHNAGTYSATLPLKQALPESVNTYFVAMEDQLFGCDLTPVVQTALSLGMTGLNEKQAGSTLSIADATIQQHQTGFTLGFAPTAALQLAEAYATVADDGVFCNSTPIVAITDSSGAAVPFKQSTCSRQLDVSVARTMVNMMTADTTSSIGTAGSYFSSWYANGGSPVASKTGTDNDSGDGNSALWYVGVTPTLVSASALVNPTSPKATVTGLPDDVSNDGADVFGAYASTFWLDAYGPTLAAQSWTWDTAADIPDAVTVPNVTGQDQTDATTTLTGAGFTVGVSATQCGSSQIVDNVAYYSPQLAAAGSKITLCLSNGESAYSR